MYMLANLLQCKLISFIQSRPNENQDACVYSGIYVFMQ